MQKSFDRSPAAASIFARSAGSRRPLPKRF